VTPSWTSPAGLPAGAVAYFAMSTTPSGWLKANGAAVSRTAYAALFTAIGTTYGVGDGSTTFNLPDLRGEFIRGWDDARGADSNRAFASAQSSQNLSHNHGANVGAAGAHSHTTNFYESGYINQPSGVGNTGNGLVLTTATSSTSANHQHTISADGGTEARPRNIALLACIKY
jgi:phage-related tail fiber protein